MKRGSLLRVELCCGLVIRISASTLLGLFIELFEGSSILSFPHDKSVYAHGAILVGKARVGHAERVVPLVIQAVGSAAGRHPHQQPGAGGVLARAQQQPLRLRRDVRPLTRRRARQ